MLRSVFDAPAPCPAPEYCATDSMNFHTVSSCASATVRHGSPYIRPDADSRTHGSRNRCRKNPISPHHDTPELPPHSCSCDFPRASFLLAPAAAPQTHRQNAPESHTRSGRSLVIDSTFVSDWRSVADSDPANSKDYPHSWQTLWTDRTEIHRCYTLQASSGSCDRASSGCRDHHDSDAEIR